MIFNKIKRFFEQNYLALASSLLLFLVTQFVYKETRERAWKRSEELFEYRTSQLQSTIQRRIGYYSQVLQGGKGLFAASEVVARDDWKNYIKTLNVNTHYPGIQGIGFTQYIRPDELPKHIEQIRSQGFPNYRLYPEGDRSEYSSIIYIEPFEGRNLRAFGFDMLSEPIRREAMERARDTDNASLSGKVTLVQETNSDVQAGFLLYLPVYAPRVTPQTVEERRQSLKGFIFSPFRAKDLMNAIIDSSFYDIDVEIYDGQTIAKESLLFTKDTTLQYFNSRAENRHYKTSTLIIEGHTWTLFFSSLPSFASTSDRNLSNLILIGGIIISILLFFILWSLTKRRKDTLIKQTITDNATAGLFMMNARGYCTFMNPAAEQMTGFTFEEIRHHPLHDMIHHTHPDGRPYPSSECPIDRALPNNNDIRNHEDIFIRKDGTFFPVTVAARPIFENGVPASTIIEVRDITEKQRIKREILESAARQRLILEAMPHIAWTATPNGAHNYYNKRWYDFTQMSFEETKDWGWQKALHPDDQQSTISAWTESIQTEKNLRIEIRFRRASDGAYRWHLCKATPIRNERGEITLWIGTNTDVHDEKLREEELQEYNRRLEALNRIGKTTSAELELTKLVQGIIDATTELTDAQFGAFFYNTLNEEGKHLTLYALSGAPLEAFAAYPIPRATAVFSPTFHGEGIVRSDDITKDSRYGKNDPFMGMPKGHLPVRSYLAVPVISRSGEVFGGLFFGHASPGVFNKNTEELVGAVATQAAIAIDNARLFEASLINRKELSLMNEELTRSNEELVKINNDLDNFIYTASHDLKAPIANIEGLSLLLKKRLTQKLEPTEVELLNMISDSINRLQRTIGDLTEITKVQKNLQENVESLSFQEVLEDVETDIAPMIKESGAVISTNFQQEHISYSRKNLRSVIYNLLSNAIKYSSPDRNPHINISTEKTEEYILFTITDNGLGIRADQKHKLFTMFKRLHTHVEGTGIGLYIIKRIVENNRGHIEVESEEGKGTTFRIYFRYDSDYSVN